MFTGTPAELIAAGDSLTGEYLRRGMATTA
jgi:hypothetical protein